MAEYLSERITVSEMSRPGMVPVVIWVPEWVEPDERKKYFVRAAKERARELESEEKFERDDPCSEFFAEYLEIVKTIPAIVSFIVKAVYQHYRREMFHPEEGGFAEHMNNIARGAM
ncbi:MAG: hypothetical protein KKB21_02415 [Nanoarchaeota archaeon]|nr:hypothetical protein [Nanoarchaeota archaeon]MBU4086409.1 hypothetical protein [Nanoarchaeota archaeon]